MTASGMAAVFATMASLLKSGDRVVASRALFGACHAILTQILPQWGIETELIEGQIFMPQESSHHNNEKHFLPINDLTGRELDMLSGLLAGKSDKEIAIKYGIALVTVKYHLKSLRGKLRKNRTHAVCSGH